MISFDEAVGRVRSVANPIGTERVSLARSAGRVLAAPVVAQLDSPRSDVSTMDGYAVRDADMDRFPVLLEVAGESFAGSPWQGPATLGTCVRIFTGAPVPAGADRVVIQEDVHREGNAVLIDKHPGPTRHTRTRKSDFGVGDELLAAGRLLDPRAIVAAAAADVAELELYRRPRLHIVNTGDELAEPGTARERADAIPESVSFGIAALAEQWGAKCIARTCLRDDVSTMQSASEAVIKEAEVVVVTGGASVGEKDFAKAMFEPLGLELLFTKVSIKPGKPVWLGQVRDTLVMGLPGNPTSALVTARLLLAPLLAGLTGRPIERALRWRTIPLALPLSACGDRETFHRARLTHGRAKALSYQESGAQKTLADADLLVRQSANSPALDAGVNVEVLDF